MEQGNSVLVTGAAGFIGFFVSQLLLDQGCQVLGIDNLNDYYSPTLKQSRLDRLLNRKGFQFKRLDFADRLATCRLFQDFNFKFVVHLGAQAGVRHSISHPHAYVDSNLVGFLNILEGCRASQVDHLVYASSSSVYGLNRKIPFSTSDNVDHPISLYAATKKANELMAHSYSHLYRLPTTGVRFFTVYGPWGRPDMAYYTFTRKIMAGEPIEIFNSGHMSRDFTYIDDIAAGVVKILSSVPSPRVVSTDDNEERLSTAPYRLYNIGNHQPVNLLEMIEILERNLGKKALKKFLPMQPGDVESTYADIDDLDAEIGFRPETPLEVGLTKFADWYRSYHTLRAVLETAS